MIGYAPLLRRGDLTLNTVLFRQAVLGDRSLTAAVRQTRGVASWRLNLFGGDAKNVAALVYGDTTLSSRIAIENSLFGIYLAGMPTQLQTALLYGVSHDGIDSPHKFGLRKTDVRHLSSCFLRSCADCVAEDLEERGYGAWRVVHQVPFLDHCPYHLRPLRELREFTTSRPNSLFGLPRHQDGTIVSREQSRLFDSSDGYAGYLGLWRRLAEEGIPQVAIDQWSELVSSAVASAGSIAKLTSMVEGTIERRWSLKVVAVGRLLGIDQNMSVQKELSLNTRARDLARRLILFDALKSLGMTPSSEESPSQQDLPFEPHSKLPRTNAVSQSISARLMRIANSLHMRPSLAVSLGNFRTIKKAMRESESPNRGEAYSIVNACSTELLQEIDSKFPAEKSNWARLAIERRRLKISGAG